MHGNYLRQSIVNAGLDADALPAADRSQTNFGPHRVKPWKDIWGAGQGVGAVKEILPVARLVERLRQEYQQARDLLAPAHCSA